MEWTNQIKAAQSWGVEMRSPVPQPLCLSSDPQLGSTCFPQKGATTRAPHWYLSFVQNWESCACLWPKQEKSTQRYDLTTVGFFTYFELATVSHGYFVFCCSFAVPLRDSRHTCPSLISCCFFKLCDKQTLNRGCFLLLGMEIT